MLYLIDNATGNAHKVGADYAVRTLLAAGHSSADARGRVARMIGNGTLGYRFLLRGRVIDMVHPAAVDAPRVPVAA